MKQANKTLWTNVEEMAVAYATESSEMKKEFIVADVLLEMQKYIKSCVNNAVRKAQTFGLTIPKEDFESRMVQYTWEAIKAFEIGGSTFKNIVMRRIGFAEVHVCRDYRSKGGENDKDGYTYEAARWDSLDRKAGGSDSEGDATLADVVLGDVPSAEEEVFAQNAEMEVIEEFAKVNERYANVMRFISLGYDGDLLAIATGEADSNNSKMRKLVQRSKESFYEFLKEKVA